MEEKDKHYTVYWKNGQREIVKGSSIARAFSNAGLGLGSLDAVDFYVEGVCDRYIWEAKSLSWWAK